MDVDIDGERFYFHRSLLLRHEICTHRSMESHSAYFCIPVKPAVKPPIRPTNRRTQLMRHEHRKGKLQPQSFFNSFLVFLWFFCFCNSVLMLNTMGSREISQGQQEGGRLLQRLTVVSYKLKKAKVFTKHLVNSEVTIGEFKKMLKFLLFHFSQKLKFLWI